MPRLHAAVLVLLLLALPAAAQSGVITGTVTDAANQQPIADVVVTARSPNLQGEQIVVTDARGNYRIPQLPPGVYTLSYEKEAYKPYSRADIRLRVAITLRVNVQLLGETAGALEYTFEGAAPTIDVGSTSTGLSIGADFLRFARGGPGDSTGGSRSFEGLGEARGQDTRALEVGRRIQVPLASTPGPVAPRLPESLRRFVRDAELRAVAPGSWQVLPPSLLPPGEEVHPLQSPALSASNFFQHYGVNPTVETSAEPVSTFSVDTDRASYTMARAHLERGALPPEASVRVEEFVNAFDYGYRHEAGADGAPFTLHAEAFPSPSRPGYHVLHLGLKAADVGREARKPAHLVFVVDTSGSMNLESRLELVKRALRLLVAELSPRDRVSVVAYGDDARVVLHPTGVEDRATILAAVDSLGPTGSTNAQAGLELGYTVALANLVPQGINRLILCSDGVANNGITEADGIWDRVKERAARHVTLTTVGFGMGNYNDVLMERLAQVGQGQYAYVDRLEEARELFVKNLSGTLQVVARDVKLQVEFDPATVQRYRLLGYENRALTREEFEDDTVDAGEVGAGHAVTALYEVKLTRPDAKLGSFRVRYQAPEGGASRLMEKALPASLVRAERAQASGAARLSLVAAAFAEKLRASYWARALSWQQLEGLWAELPEGLRARPEVAELGQLLLRARGLDTRADRFERIAPLASMDFDRPPVVR